MHAQRGTKIAKHDTLYGNNYTILQYFCSLSVNLVLKLSYNPELTRSYNNYANCICFDLSKYYHFIILLRSIFNNNKTYIMTYVELILIYLT